MKKNKTKNRTIVFLVGLAFLIALLTANFLFGELVLAQSGEDPLAGTNANEVFQNATGGNISSTNPNPVSGAGGAYQNQEKIPGASQQQSEFIPYVKDIINFGFAILGILALFMLIIGAYQYLIAAGTGNVANAKETVASALLGLILGMCAWIILNKINPDLVNMREITKISGGGGAAPATSPSGTPTGTGTPSNLAGVQCQTVKDYTGFMNNNLSSLYNESKVNSAQDLQNALTSFRKNNNGLTQYSGTLYQACKDNNVPFWYMIGTFAKESSMFSEGSSGCSKYNNPGCMMSNGQYINYATPEEGIKANIANMGRLLQNNPTPLGAWNAWYWPDRPGNCAGAQEYLDMFGTAAKVTGLST